ncbi:MAG: hypothetical protein PSN04_06940 [Methyloprofundus sp.]|nr:hypothetical protein [Methyloprofundus sp.]
MKGLKPKYVTCLILFIIICTPALQAEQVKNVVSVQTRLVTNENTPYFSKLQTTEETETLVNLYQFNNDQLLWFNIENPITIINQLLVIFSSVCKLCKLSALSKFKGIVPA